MGKIFILGRSLNTLYAAIAILILFAAVKKAYNARTALISALFFAVSPGIVFQAHIMKPYMLSMVFFLAALYFSMRLIEKEDKFSYVMAGIFSGLTAGSMLPYSLVFLVPLAAHFVSVKKNHINLVFLFLAAALSFCATNPYWIIDFPDVSAAMRYSRSCYASEISLSKLLSFITGQIPQTMSASMSVIALCGIAYAFIRRNKQDIVLLASCLVPLLIFSYLLQNQFPSMHTSRFFLPWFVMASVLGASLTDFLLSKKKTMPAAVLLLALVLIPSTLYSLLMVKNFKTDASESSTRFNAGRWIDKNLPAGAKIGIFSLPEPAMIPPFDFSKYRLVLLKNDFSGNTPDIDYFVVINNDIFGLNPKFKNDFKVFKSFEPDEQILGISFNVPQSHVNAKVVVYQRSVKGAR
jgi:4-amino-4-deoxy-L-arabinose transferase-like glycosyltransferase